MSAAPLVAGLPPNLQLNDGYVVRLTAIDASTGATVSGVTVSDATIQVVNLGGGSAQLLASGPYSLVPGPGG